MTSGPTGLRVRCAAGCRSLVGSLLILLLGACASSDPYQGLETESLWSAAVEAYEDGDWAEAVRAFDRFVSQNPADARIPEARMMTARAYMEDGDALLAASEFERFLVQHGSHGLAPEASLGACRAYARLAPHRQRDQANTQRALDACANTVQEFGGLSVAQEADSIRVVMQERLAARAYDEARFYQRMGAHNSAILYFEELVQGHFDTDWAPRGLLGMHRSYCTLGWMEEAQETVDRLVLQFPDSEAAGDLREQGARTGDGDAAPGC